MDWLGFSRRELFSGQMWKKPKKRRREAKKWQSKQTNVLQYKVHEHFEEQTSLFLTLYHTIPVVYNPKIEDLKMSWEEEKMLVTSILSFSLNLFYAARNKF